MPRLALALSPPDRLVCAVSRKREIGFMGLVLGGRESGRETERDRRERERERERPCCLENSFMEQSRAKW